MFVHASLRKREKIKLNEVKRIDVLYLVKGGRGEVRGSVVVTLCLFV